MSPARPILSWSIRGRAGKEVYQAMLQEGVIIRAMDAYGFPEYIRVNVGLPQENRRFLAALKKVLGLGAEWGIGLIITIDGPAGVGKSTVGRRLAQSLGYLYVDSGALYRAVAWQALAAGAGSGGPGRPGPPCWRPSGRT